MQAHWLISVSPGPSSSGRGSGRSRARRDDVLASTCVSAEGARTRAAAGSCPASERSWRSCLWRSGGGGDKQTQDVS